MRRLLCRIGFHDWTLLGFTSLTLADSLEQCRVCGIGRMMIAFGSAQIRYTKEQMTDLIRVSNCTPSAPPSSPTRPSRS